MKKQFKLAPLMVAIVFILSGCAVVTVASTAVGVAGTVVGAGISVGSAVVSGTVGVVKAVTPDS